MKKGSLLPLSSRLLQQHRSGRVRVRRAPTMRCIHRVILAFTGAMLMALAWNFYRFGYSVKELQQQQNTVRNPKKPGIYFQELRKNRDSYESPERIRKSFGHENNNKAMGSSGGDGDGITEIPEEPKELRDKHPSGGGPPEWKWLKARKPRESSEGSLCRSFDHSIHRPRHGCKANKDTKTVFCNFENLRIDIDKIEMAAAGGEVLSKVMGRNEMDELPTYQKAAFATPTKPDFDVPANSRKNLHYLENVLNAMRYPTQKNKDRLDLTCKTTYPGTTLFLTRYEYVNLFHTLTDWWNAYFVLPRKTNGDGVAKPDRVVFLDGHAEGLLDPVWESLFGTTHYIQHMEKGGICFERAIFVPPGYKSPLYNDLERDTCPHKGMAKAFSDYVLDSYGLGHETTSVVPGKIVVIDRQPFVSHPRSKPENFSRMFEISELSKLRSRLETIPGANVQLVRLETLSFGKQLELLRSTHVLLGIHGAALSHIMFMDETESHAIEFQPSTQLGFFDYLSKWKGIDHSAIGLLWDSEGSDTLTDEGIEEAVELVTKYVGEGVSGRGTSWLW